MGEVTEKIYCCDRGDNDNALAAAILAGNNRRDDWGPMAAMMGGGMNNWMNNPFAYLMFMALLLASWLRRLTLTSTLFRSAAAMFRLLSSKLLVRLASLLSALSTLLTWVIATSFKLYRIATAKLNARLQISVLICYFRTVKTHLRFAMANAILVLQLHKVSQLLLSRLSKISAIFFVPVRTILNASSTL